MRKFLPIISTMCPAPKRPIETNPRSFLWKMRAIISITIEVSNLPETDKNEKRSSNRRGICCCIRTVESKSNALSLSDFTMRVKRAKRNEKMTPLARRIPKNLREKEGFRLFFRWWTAFCMNSMVSQPLAFRLG